MFTVRATLVACAVLFAGSVTSVQAGGFHGFRGSFKDARFDAPVQTSNGLYLRGDVSYGVRAGPGNLYSSISGISA